MTKVDLPAKLTPDMIHEALFELRFEHAELSELVIGKLATLQGAGWSPFRLPAAEIPDLIRMQDPALRAVPILELRSPDGTEIIRIGSLVVSHHVLGAYIGWPAFQPKLLATIGLIRSAIPSMKPTRLGLRYVNAATEEWHGLRSVWDLNIQVHVGQQTPDAEMQLVYSFGADRDLRGLVRVFTPSFIEESPVPSATAYIDIDMFTPDSTAIPSADGIADWLERAHDAEKLAFFGLLTERTTSFLREQ